MIFYRNKDFTFVAGLCLLENNWQMGIYVVKRCVVAINFARLILQRIETRIAICVVFYLHLFYLQKFELPI